MTEMEVAMDEDGNETERLGQAMAASARLRPGFIGGAMAVWERAHPGRSAVELLRCNEKQAWRLAVTPRPIGPDMVRQALELATDLGVNPTALVNVLRFAESAEAFTNSNDDGEMLMAALDSKDEEDDGH